MENKKILVVDDEEAIRDSFQQAFSSVGYTVKCAESAEDANRRAIMTHL